MAEWVQLAGQTAGADCADSLSDGRKAGPQHKPSGINAATRELGIERTKAQRAMKVAALAPEAKQAARDSVTETVTEIVTHHRARVELLLK